jgi:single-stranded-DNA-specific exonuclease
MEKRWELKEQDPRAAQQIAERHQLSPILSQILLNRNLTDPEFITRFLQPSLAHLPDPNEMKDMDRAVDRLVAALEKKEKITIYGDYDVDGTTATALLMDFFQALGADINFYIPHRLKEGYSLNRGAIEKLAAGGTKILITVDNGISALEEAKQIQKLGMDLIITDHHEVPPELPPAVAILNPKQAGDSFPGKELAGVGVAYYLLIALRRRLRELNRLPDHEPNLRGLLDLVAVGTIADMAPLTGVNRILVAEGLKVLSGNPRLGLRALMEVSGIAAPVRADQVAFWIGPRINAVGRLEDAATGVSLLLCEDPPRARDLARQLDAANAARREIEDKIVEEALAQIETQKLREKFQALVLCQPHWHHGVVGIVASRLVDRFYRPAIVLTEAEGMLKGSARSVRGLNIVEALRACSAQLERFGGHAYAAGLTLRPENLPAFVEQFDRHVREKLSPDQMQPSVFLDAESPLDQLNPAFMEHLARLEPFGLGNPAPLFLLKGAQVRESRIVGERHLKMQLTQGRHSLGAIAFRLAKKQPEAGARVDVAFVPEWNEWNGSKSIQLRCVDLRAAES